MAISQTFTIPSSYLSKSSSSLSINFPQGRRQTLSQQFSLGGLLASLSIGQKRVDCNVEGAQTGFFSQDFVPSFESRGQFRFTQGSITLLFDIAEAIAAGFNSDDVDPYNWVSATENGITQRLSAFIAAVSADTDLTLELIIPPLTQQISPTSGRATITAGGQPEIGFLSGEVFIDYGKIPNKITSTAPARPGQPTRIYLIEPADVGGSQTFNFTTRDGEITSSPRASIGLQKATYSKPIIKPSLVLGRRRALLNSFSIERSSFFPQANRVKLSIDQTQEFMGEVRLDLVDSFETNGNIIFRSGTNTFNFDIAKAREQGWRTPDVEPYTWASTTYSGSVFDDLEDFVQNAGGSTAISAEIVAPVTEVILNESAPIKSTLSTFAFNKTRTVEIPHQAVDVTVSSKVSVSVDTIGFTSSNEIVDLTGPSYINSRSVSRIRINKPNIVPEIGWTARTKTVDGLEIIKVAKTIDLPLPPVAASLESTLNISVDFVPFIKTVEITDIAGRANIQSQQEYDFEQRLTTRIATESGLGVLRSGLNIEVQKRLLNGQEVFYSIGTSKIESDILTKELFLIKPPPPPNTFILRPIDFTRAGNNIIALWQPPSGSLLPVPQNLWASNQQLFLGFVRLGTSGVVQLRFRASQVAPSGGVNDDISSDFEDNGFILFESGGESVSLNVGGLDTTEPYGYSIVGQQLADLQAFLRSLPLNTNSISMTLYTRQPPRTIGIPAAKTGIVSSQAIEINDISTYTIEQPPLATSIQSTINTPISSFSPLPTVGWAAVIEGIGFGRRFYRVWSGVGQLELDGDTYEGTTFEGGSLASIGQIETTIGSPSTRTTVSIAVPSAAVRAMLNIDIGPVWVRVFNVVSQDNGLSWTKLPTGIAGRLSRPVFEVEASVYTIEIETWSGDADRGRVEVWSNESQEREFAGDKGFEFARGYESGVDIRWPP